MGDSEYPPYCLNKRQAKESQQIVLRKQSEFVWARGSVGFQKLRRIGQASVLEALSSAKNRIQLEVNVWSPRSENI